MPSTNTVVKELFLDVLDMRASDRERFLGERCGADAALRSRVQRLLEAHRASEAMFGAATPESALAAGAAHELHAESRVGQYVLVEEVGEGGFAVVWRAQQVEPVSRAVALKVLKAGMDTRQVVARFEAERQALALMDHPCIAKVFDGGATESGRPWFAMELVHGKQITEFCDHSSVDKRGRLELFVDVCRAVQHAHQKGVIHRDLKPSNVLVSRVDGRATPKVIDFGIAKAVERRLTDDSILTLEGQIIGTPAYMSPEQVDESGDIDTRCDVYALGALLYELLTGSKPFEEDTLGVAGLAEVLRIIREVEPPRPSTRLGSTTHVMSRELRGDLDWIVMRCLEKDRERRYDSAGALANEIERHLAGDPVLAGPPDIGYRIEKFVRRHRVGIAVSAAIVILLVAGVAVSLALMLRAQQAERELSAESVRREMELAKYQSISTFFEDALMSVNPSHAQGKDTELLRDVLDRAAARVEEDSGGVAEVEATIRRVIGGAYQSLAVGDKAEAQLSRALEIRVQELDADDPDLLQSQLEFGSFYLAGKRLDEAEPLLLAALDGYRRVVGAEHESTLESQANVALLYRSQGRLDLAEEMLAEVESIRLAKHGERHPDSIRAINNLASLHRNQGRLEEAVERFQLAADLQLDVQGRLHPDTLKALTNLGGILVDLGRTSEALEYLLLALELKREVLPDGDRSLIVSMNSLARLYQGAGRAREAEDMYLAAREMMDRTDTRGTSHCVIMSFNYAAFLSSLDRDAEAEAEYRAAATAARQSLGPESGVTITVDSALAWQVHRGGRSAEALPLAQSALERAEQRMPPEHPEVGMQQVRLGIMLLAAGQRDESVAALQAGLPVVRAGGIQNWVEMGEDALREAGVDPGD